MATNTQNLNDPTATTAQALSPTFTPVPPTLIAGQPSTPAIAVPRTTPVLAHLNQPPNDEAFPPGVAVPRATPVMAHLNTPPSDQAGPPAVAGSSLVPK